MKTIVMIVTTKQRLLWMHYTCVAMGCIMLLHQFDLPTLSATTTTTTTPKSRSEYMERQLVQLFIQQEKEQQQYNIIVHPNGNANCSYRMSFDTLSTDSVQQDESNFLYISTKYQTEATITEYIANHMKRMSNVSNNEVVEWECWDSPNQEEISSSFYKYCDMGTEYTVIQRDHDKLVRVGDIETSNNDDDSSYLPCRFYTREGIRITSIEDIILQQQQQYTPVLSEEHVVTDTTLEMDGTTITTSNQRGSSDVTEYHIYAVPAGRVFMFAPKYVNETFQLPHIVLPPATDKKSLVVDDELLSLLSLHENEKGDNYKSSDTNVISLQVLNVVPPIYEITNLFTKQETYELLQKAIQEKDATYSFHRSTTGTSSSNVYQKRTSENAWDTHGKTAQIIKRRCFQLLGFDEYDEEMTDGLQILRYNLTTAYVSHLDYLEDRAKTEDYDYDTSFKGGNRFATIILYFTTIQEGAGGETVFPYVYPPNLPIEDRLSDADVLHALRTNPETKGILRHGSWEEQMTVQCRTRFAVRPQAFRAILFYSQYPNGTLDPLSYHGGCPVLNGTKLAANMWTWSAIRPEFEGGPLRDSVVKQRTDTGTSDDETSSVDPLHVTFRNRGTDERFRHADLYYGSLSTDTDGAADDVFFSKLGFDHDTIAVNTYVGHIWYIKDSNTLEVLETFAITDDHYNGDEESVVFEV